MAVEKDKVRVLHDGAHSVAVNNRSRVRDQLACPAAGEKRSLMKKARAAGSRLFSVVGDVERAHRRFTVRPSDWGWQACPLRPGTTWLNKVGAYGIGMCGLLVGPLGGRRAVRGWWW